jgi:malate dehydrogenase (oxaloacetate-decarboxylating)
MEGKSMLFRKFGDINCIPLVLDTQDAEEIISTIRHISG